MADRITEKKLKSFLETDKLFTLAPFKLSIYNGYYHILDEFGDIIVCEKTAGKCWEIWNVYKKGYCLGIKRGLGNG